MADASRPTPAFPAAALALSLALAAAAPAAAETSVSHGLSAFGALKYAEDFERFDYVNPDAPKGGRIALRPQIATRTFDNFNPYITRGDGAAGADLLFDSLMARAFDEPDAVYGLVAQSVETPPDRSFAIFNLRPEARFSDGSPLTADDVVFSITALRDKGSPQMAVPLRPVEAVTALGPHRVRVDFREGAPTRDLPARVGVMPIFSAADFADREFDEPDRNTAPLGSGPYRVKDFINGRYVTYERREDYWAKDLSVNVGQWNFDEIRFEYYADADVALEVFSAGGFDLNEEFRSLNWATKYTFPAIEEGLIIKEVLPDDRASGTQGFWFNTRREKFADPRTREAIALAFDFEWSNQRLFYNLYTRTDSFFENGGDLQASGAPTPEESALLEPFRAALPAALFEDDAYSPPKSDASGADRRLLRRARRLLAAAGWETTDGVLKNAEGETLSIEFLEVANGGMERIARPFIANLEALGIAASMRGVDRAQFESRLKSFDFDMVVRRYVPGDTPGPALRGILSSASANVEGSFNVAGVSSPVIDAMLDKIEEAKTRDDAAAAARALDRVFRAEHYWVPNWHKASHTIAYWDRFGRPQDLGIDKPRFDRGILRTWWLDAEKSARIDANR